MAGCRPVIEVSYGCSGTDGSLRRLRHNHADLLAWRQCGSLSPASSIAIGPHRSPVHGGFWSRTLLGVPPAAITRRNSYKNPGMKEAEGWPSSKRFLLLNQMPRHET